MTHSSWFRWASILAIATLAVSCASLDRVPDFGAAITVNFVTDTPEAREYDLSWTAPREKWGTSHAVAIVPKSVPRGPGIVYFHQLGLARNWTEFEDEALTAAKTGVRSVLVDGQAPWGELWNGTNEDREMIAAQMDDLRRSVRILVSLPGTDQARLAFVGHDYGAMYGALLSGEETPISAFVLVAPAPSWTDWISYSQFLPELVAGYPAITGDLDPVVVAASRPGVARLLQFSRSDRFLSPAAQARMATIPGVTVQTIEESSHESVIFDGADRRHDWLTSRWSLP